MSGIGLDYYMGCPESIAAMYIAAGRDAPMAKMWPALQRASGERAKRRAKTDRLNPQTIPALPAAASIPLPCNSVGERCYVFPAKPQTRAELQADSDRLNRQVIADLQQYASVLCGMPLPVGSAIESATEGLPPKPYPPGPYPPPAPPPPAAHRMVSVKDDHAVHGPDGLRIFAGRGRKGKWRAEIIAAALDGRWADAQWAQGVIDD